MFWMKGDCMATESTELSEMLLSIFVESVDPVATKKRGHSTLIVQR